MSRGEQQPSEEIRETIGEAMGEMSCFMPRSFPYNSIKRNLYDLKLVDIY